MGKAAQRKHSIFNAGKKEAIKMKKMRDTPTGWIADKEDGKWYCPYIANCKVGKLWLLGWHCGWKFGSTAYYKD